MIMIPKVRHAQWSWSWAVKSVRLNQRFVQALLAAHYEFPEMMDKRLLLSHIQSLGRVLRAYAMQQPEFVELEETAQEDLLRRNTPIFVQVPQFRQVTCSILDPGFQNHRSDYRFCFYLIL